MTVRELFDAIGYPYWQGSGSVSIDPDPLWETQIVPWEGLELVPGSLETDVKSNTVTWRMRAKQPQP